MNARSKACLIVIALLMLAFPALRRAGDVRYDPQTGIVETLPAAAGPWTGDAYSYCTNQTCDKVWKASELAGRTNCPTCGSGLATMALIERQLLPGDTAVQRAEYTTRDGQKFIVSLVFSGRDRASIHRPEVCLAGIGNGIADARDIEVALQGRGPLPLHVLTLKQDYRDASGVTRTRSTFFAYWFVSKDHETASHIDRMIHMASDRIFHGVTRRWAYISIAGSMPANGDPAPQLREFLREFVPQLTPR
jgi:hypothetical protein